MPSLNPAVAQWIRQMGDEDQVVAYFAYQSLQEEVFRASKPGEEAAQAALAAALGQALTAQARPGQGARGRGTDSFRGNVFLAAAAQASANPLHPARVRSLLARLLGYLPTPAAVPYLAAALNDLDAREMARQALECNASEAATEALLKALDGVGPVFAAGIISSLAKKKGERVSAALRKAAEDPQIEVRVAALYALADIPEPAHDSILEKAAGGPDAEIGRAAHVARVRLAGTLAAAGNREAARRVWQAVLASGAPEPQKKAARLALGA